MGKQNRNRRSQSSGVGLLFVSKERYLERVWDAAKKQALDQGFTEDQANKMADRALNGNGRTLAGAKAEE